MWRPLQMTAFNCLHLSYECNRIQGIFRHLHSFTLVVTVWGRPFYVTFDLMYKSSSIKTQFDVDYLWDELECGLQARSSILGSILDLTNALLPQTHSKILWKAFPEEWRLLMPQEGQHISGLGFGIG